jgi:hypothetical protein
MPYNIQNDFLGPADEVIVDNSIKQTTITKEQLDELWNALGYTRATISGGGDVLGKLDCFSINKGRAYQSYEYLKKSIDIVNQLKRELQ